MNIIDAIATYLREKHGASPFGGPGFCTSCHRHMVHAMIAGANAVGHTPECQYHR